MVTGALGVRVTVGVILTVVCPLAWPAHIWTVLEASEGSWRKGFLAARTREV